MAGKLTSAKSLGVSSIHYLEVQSDDNSVPVVCNSLVTLFFFLSLRLSLHMSCMPFICDVAIDVGRAHVTLVLSWFQYGNIVFLKNKNK